MGKVIVFQKGSLERKQINALFTLFEGLIEFAPGRAVAKIYRENDSVFVKRYRRSMKPWWKRILRRGYRSPLRSEAMLLSRLQVLDFPAPKPLMYAESRRPGFHESLLLTGFLPGVPLATLSGDELLVGARQSLALLGQLHAHGIVHGDCNPYNFLVSEHAHLLDFERAGDFTPYGAVEDFKKIMHRLADLGLDESSLSEVAGAYSIGAGAPVFDVQASLLELRGMAFVRKPTRWRPPQELRIAPPVH
ncbi:lipopolysaccharide kinase InaA family protein [Pseudomonas sp. MM211]|uniref:lipopolysaccharide kinase InaA family protein n=1 Tax=Pseudomonas sp. MM211 TaxID=2866808 RepID=UPI001CEC1955|nr:lipopolysaccharide kinase InaA family protein [Pseudomonas sp. MM211]UCJ17303.1 lipopolysaccharide kinase InaA family protein [Pseudomonas sp. MM211]